jgi:hypothetical protein
MTAVVEQFTDGVLAGHPYIFQGEIEKWSSKGGVFAHLVTSLDYQNSLDKSHENDVFKWNAGDVDMEMGFGKLFPGQLRAEFTFKMQHSTGRFVEDAVLAGGVGPYGVTDHETGKCVRITNHALTPEEEYELKD